LKKKKCQEKTFETKRAEVGAKSERVEQELEGKFLPFFAFFFLLYGFFFFVFFCFLLVEKSKMLRESV